MKFYGFITDPASETFVYCRKAQKFIEDYLNQKFDKSQTPTKHRLTNSLNAARNYLTLCRGNAVKTIDWCDNLISRIDKKLEEENK